MEVVTTTVVQSDDGRQIIKILSEDAYEVSVFRTTRAGLWELVDAIHAICPMRPTPIEPLQRSTED